MTLDNDGLKSVGSGVAFVAVLVVPYLAFAWYLCMCVRNVKKSWGYITLDGQRIFNA